MQKTNPYTLETTACTPAPIASAGTPAARPAAGRPTAMTKQVVDALCSVIRHTGTSDSGAAARMSLHPSTVSRWKKENPDFAIMLRAAREDFRETHLAIITATAEMGGRSGWRASCWLLERVFPEDYAPRAAERAKFQERFDAVCASEAEGDAVELPGLGEPLQNVKNTPPPPARPAAPAPEFDLDLPLQLTQEGKVRPIDIHHAERELQNVKNATLAGRVCPPALTKNFVGA